jgi:hypothetical protein
VLDALEELASDVLHGRDGALAHERDRLRVGAEAVACGPRCRTGCVAQVSGIASRDSRAEDHARTRWYDIRLSREPQDDQSNENSEKQQQHELDFKLVRSERRLPLSKISHVERIGNSVNTLSSCAGPDTGSGGMDKPLEKEAASSPKPIIFKSKPGQPALEHLLHLIVQCRCGEILVSTGDYL